jgi:hypothetical protein
MLKSIEINKTYLALRMLTLNWSREAEKGGNMMRDIGAYFCSEQKRIKCVTSYLVEGMYHADLSELTVDVYRTINDWY